ncbi:hypothetical protein JOB18_039617 [Solea senegalensis]|uniref:Uncharacterized protein n=1 Tax=Solea senegalensis TaxID=28829 RepID=A0AAV6RTM9_SOLSE|nr:hypothetical protein JOB18_039617 [Solea senegalensis]
MTSRNVLGSKRSQTSSRVLTLRPAVPVHSHVIKMRDGVGQHILGKDETRKDGCHSSLGQHNTLITSHLSSISSPHSRCLTQPNRNLKIIYSSLCIFFFLSFAQFSPGLLCPSSRPMSFALLPLCCPLYS